MEQTSFQRINRLEKNLRSQSRGIRSIIIVLAAAAAVFGTVSFITLKNYRLQDNAFYLLFTLMYVLMCAAGIALSATLFKELYSKPFADSAFSQPFTSGERYLAKLLLVVKAHILPMAAVTFIVPLTAKIFCPAASSNPRTVLIFTLCAIGGAIFAEACFFLFAGFCGTAVTCILVPLAMAVSVSLLPCLTVEWFYSFSGNVTRPEFVLYHLLSHFGSFDFIGFSNLTEFQFSEYATVADIAVIVCVNILLAALMIFFGYKVYRRRNGLNSGKPFTSAVFYNVFFAFCIVPLFLISMRGGLYNGIIYSLIASLVITILRLRRQMNLHAVMGMLIRMAACCGAAFGLTFLVYITYGFGIPETSPERSAVEGSKIELDSICLLDHNDTLNNPEVVKRDWKLNTNAIEPGQENKAAMAIFEYMRDHSELKPEHTADRFLDDLKYGDEEYEEDSWFEKSRGKWYVSLYINPRNAEGDYHYYVYMSDESMDNMPAELEAQGVPIIYKNSEDEMD